jgi:5-methylcytosine-specific restriction endonuclease McrA
MAGADIPEALRAAVRERAKARCEYCLTAEALSGIRCQADHIVPRSLDGPTTLDNLCLVCIAWM